MLLLLLLLLLRSCLFIVLLQHLYLPGPQLPQLNSTQHAVALPCCSQEEDFVFKNLPQQPCGIAAACLVQWTPPQQGVQQGDRPWLPQDLCQHQRPQEGAAGG
jgi:hypothetical protein